MKMKNINLQDVFLNQVRKAKLLVTVYLTNGFQFKGIVKGFDSYVVILDCEGRQNLVYKHAISTVIPAKAISIHILYKMRYEGVENIPEGDGAEEESEGEEWARV